MTGPEADSPNPLDLKLETLPVDLLRQLVAIGSDENAAPHARAMAASIAKVAINQVHSNRLIALLFESLKPEITQEMAERYGLLQGDTTGNSSA